MSPISEAEVEAFTYGDCWRLAADLHRLTGWQMVAVGVDFQMDTPLDERGWAHMAVITPNDIVVDVMGATPVEQWLERWRDATLTDFWNSSDAGDLEYGDVDVEDFTFGVEGWAELISGQHTRFPQYDSLVCARTILASLA